MDAEWEVQSNRECRENLPLSKAKLSNITPVFSENTTSILLDEPRSQENNIVNPSRSIDPTASIHSPGFFFIDCSWSSVVTENVLLSLDGAVEPKNCM